MPSNEHGPSKLTYGATLGMLTLAAAFPIALMIFDPTLMFERGWEQYVGTGIYFWAVGVLTWELRKLWRNEQAFEDVPSLVQRVERACASSGSERPASDQSGLDSDPRLLPSRVRQLTGYLEETGSPSVSQLMELNREASGLDQEHASGRFTLTRYILYLLPVIGFIGTVEGISKALMNISKVLPMVKDLDGFMNNLTGVTSALQIAFDSTLLALFLSASLMLVQTLVFRRSEDLLARVDRWIVESILPKVGAIEPAGRHTASPSIEHWAERLGEQIAQFSRSIDALPRSVASFQHGAEVIARVGTDLDAVGTASESIRRGVASLARIEANLGDQALGSEQFEEIKRGIDRTCAAIESMSNSWASAYERSSRTTQEQLARTLNSLKDAIDLLNVSMEQGNALYRNIVKKMLPVYHGDPDRSGDGIRVA